MGPLARKLRALQYPNLETFDVNDPLQVKTLIIWLEDRKIRNLVPEERVNLRLAEGEAWSQEFERVALFLSADNQLFSFAVPNHTRNQSNSLDECLDRRPSGHFG